MTDEDMKKQMTTYADAITAFSLVQSIALIYAFAQGEGFAQHVFQGGGPFAVTLGIVLGTSIYCFLIYQCDRLASLSPSDVMRWIQRARLVIVIIGGTLSIIALWLLKSHPLPSSPTDAVSAGTTIMDSPLLGTQGKGWIDIAALLIGFATFVVVAIYTWLTHRLRVAAQNQIVETDKLLAEAQLQNKLAVKPMFAVYMEKHGLANRITLENVGFGPAFNIAIQVPEWAGMRMEIPPTITVMKPGDKHYPSYIPDPTDTGGSNLDAELQDLFGHLHLLHIKKDVGSILIVVTCESLSLTHYDFYFRWDKDPAGRIKVTYEGENPPTSLARRDEPRNS